MTVKTGNTKLSERHISIDYSLLTWINSSIRFHIFIYMPHLDSWSRDYVFYVCLCFLWSVALNKIDIIAVISDIKWFFWCDVTVVKIHITKYRIHNCYTRRFFPLRFFPTRAMLNWLMKGPKSNLAEPTALQTLRAKQIEQLRYFDSKWVLTPHFWCGP